eukprot:7672636-Pyramimonas_sp.AAC.1
MLLPLRQALSHWRGIPYAEVMVAGLLETLNEAHNAMAPDPNDPKSRVKPILPGLMCSVEDMGVSLATRKKREQRAVSRLGAACFDLESFAK